MTAFRYSKSPGIIEAAETALTAKVATMIAVSGGAANFLLVTVGVNVKVLRGAGLLCPQCCFHWDERCWAHRIVTGNAGVRLPWE